MRIGELFVRELGGNVGRSLQGRLLYPRSIWRAINTNRIRKTVAIIDSFARRPFLLILLVLLSFL